MKFQLEFLANSHTCFLHTGEANNNKNTYRMLELLVKYLKVYPASKFKDKNKSISSNIWTAIANDFDNEVSTGSIRKKYSTVMQLYKVSL